LRSVDNYLALSDPDFSFLEEVAPQHVYSRITRYHLIILMFI